MDHKAMMGLANPDISPRQWICKVCGWVYDEAAGDPDSGIAPGTPFEAIPADWFCPDCGVKKEDFVILSVKW
jgi:rubredoxin-NAD+ reductase